MPYFFTAKDAKQAGISGWNLRCNRCGTYGANWRFGLGERKGWGELALCREHGAELSAEYDRHRLELERLCAVQFEQAERKSA